MSDFLITFDSAADPDSILRLLQAPYGATRRPGQTWRLPWGVAALLQEPVARGGNLACENRIVRGWVGDAPGAREALEFLVHAFGSATADANETSPLSDALRRAGAATRWNGSYAAVVAGPTAVAIVTDPMAGVQVYLATDAHRRVTALGTHADVVAAAAGLSDDVDPVSVGEFLSSGTPCCPHTMYGGVTELGAGQIVTVECRPDGTRRLSAASHWQPPAELPLETPWTDVAAEFRQYWTDAVRVRCQGERLGLQLSGGLDSRAILAVLPPDKSCVALTYCDTLNREARLARAVAAAYGRPWRPLMRDPEYLAQTAIDAIRYTGCEGEWHHAHGIGFLREFESEGFDEVFTGLFMDNNFKGYYAKDLKSVTRRLGLRRPTWKSRPRDYVEAIHPLCREILTPGILKAMTDRRRQFYDRHWCRGRRSEWEWLDGHPLSQASDNTGWIVERRLFPLRLPTYDRRLVDLALRIPAPWKLAGQFFADALAPLLGPGRRVPNANDGVRPGSPRASRTIQRGIREAENLARGWLARAGVRTEVPHSWHDYQAYWRESPLLAQLLAQHRHHLAPWHGPVLRTDPAQLVRRPDIPWRVGCRLVQLAIWSALVRSYRADAYSNP